MKSVNSGTSTICICMFWSLHLASLLQYLIEREVAMSQYDETMGAISHVVFTLSERVMSLGVVRYP